MIDQLQDILQKWKWRPKYGKNSQKYKPVKIKKTWKAFGEDRKNPVFQCGINPGDVFSSYQPVIEVTKYHAGGIGSVWSLDQEACDKLIIMLLTARKELVNGK